MTEKLTIQIGKGILTRSILAVTLFGMERIARLNGQSVAPGATLSIAGRILQTGDRLKLEDNPNGTADFIVKAFGLGRLVIESADDVFELRPWHKGDEPTISLPGPMSAWTITSHSSRPR